MTTVASATEYVCRRRAADCGRRGRRCGNARTVVLVRKDAADAPIVVALPSVRTLHGAFFGSCSRRAGCQRRRGGSGATSTRSSGRRGERFIGPCSPSRRARQSRAGAADQRYLDGTTLDFVLGIGVGGTAGACAHQGAAHNHAADQPLADGRSRGRGLRGRHPIRYNGRDLVVTVATVAVKREAEAAFGGLDGDTSGPVVIVDAGGRTVNVALFSNGQVPLGPHA